MDTIKLERNGKVIVRSKADYEMNKSNYDLRGFKEAIAKPKPKPEPKAEKPKEEPKPTIEVDQFNNKAQKKKDE